MRWIAALLFVALPACQGGSPDAQNASLDVELLVRAFFGPDTPAGEGAVVEVNGEEVGTTGPDGTFAARVAPGEVDVWVFVPGLAGARAVVDVTADAELELTLEGEGLIDGTTLEIEPLVPGVAGNVLDGGFGTFTARFVRDDGTTAPLQDITTVTIDRRDGGPFADLTPFFELLPDGTLASTDADALRAAFIDVGGEVAFLVRGDDDRGLVHHGTVRFHVGRFFVSGVLAAPPSQPALPVAAAGIVVKATFLTLEGAGLVYETLTDAAGRFRFDFVPTGSLVFDVPLVDAGLVYTGFGNLAVNADTDIVLTLLTTEDVLNGVQSIERTALTGRADAPDPVRLALHAAHEEARALATDDVEVMAQVASQARDETITDQATLGVSKDTQTVTLTFNVVSSEYPVFVKQQSQFDDVWELKVLAKNGTILFGISSRVNAMLNEPPKWQTDGTTGDIVETLDVSAFTAAADTEITLHVASTNVGDGLLATTVTASLSFESGFTIASVTADQVETRLKNNCRTVGTKLASDFYSLPNLLESNTLHRHYTLKLTGRPPGATIDGVTVDLFDENNPQSEIGILADQLVDGVLVKEIDPETLEVRVTQEFAFVLPERAHEIQHRFRVNLDVNGQILEATKESGRRFGLYRMPDLFQRVGGRDKGGDDWCSKDCYRWLEQHAALLTRINDISGEHANDIGHCTHLRGTDIDMYHFTDLTGLPTPNGKTNFRILRDHAVAALTQCQTLGECTPEQVAALLQPLKDWFTEARAGLTALADLSTVKLIYFVKGKAEMGLPKGWADTLLRTGKLSDGIGRSFDLGIGAWNHAKVTADQGHNDHVHVALDEVAIRNP